MTQKPCRVSRPGAWIAALVLGVGVAMTADASGAERLEGPTWLAEDIKGGGVIDNAQSKIEIAAGGKGGRLGRLQSPVRRGNDCRRDAHVRRHRHHAHGLRAGADGSGAEIPGRACRHTHLPARWPVSQDSTMRAARSWCGSPRSSDPGAVRVDDQDRLDRLAAVRRSATLTGMKNRSATWRTRQLRGEGRPHIRPPAGQER